VLSHNSQKRSWWCVIITNKEKSREKQISYVGVGRQQEFYKFYTKPYKSICVWCQTQKMAHHKVPLDANNVVSFSKQQIITFCCHKFRLINKMMLSLSAIKHKRKPLFIVLSLGPTVVNLKTHTNLHNDIYPSSSWLGTAAVVLPHTYVQRMTSHPGYLLTSLDHGWPWQR